MSSYKYHDGGRKTAGYKGSAGDCVVRAIAIATGRKYQTVYNWMQKDKRKWYKEQYGVTGARLTHLSAPYRGISQGHYGPYLRKAGWAKFLGDETCTVGELANSFRSQTVIVRSKKTSRAKGVHLSCIRKGVVLDTWDCRESIVLDYWRKL